MSQSHRYKEIRLSQLRSFCLAAARIHWIQKLAKSGPNAANVDTSPAVKQFIPPQYNVKSTLTKEITMGTNKLDFDLKSK
jgi:hypothetical protein